MSFRAIAALLGIAAVSAGCAAPRSDAPAAATPHAPSSFLLVQVAEEGNAVRRIRLEDYLTATVLSELAPAGDPDDAEQMLEVQAIIARSYALASRGRHAAQGFDVCSTTHCQLYQPSRLKSSRWTATALEAVGRTKNVVLLYGGVPILALFHADCGGHTSTSGEVWGGSDRPYLPSMLDDGPAQDAHPRWTFAVDASRLAQALARDPRTSVGTRIDLLTVLDRTSSGRVRTIALHGERERLVKGEVLRDVVARELGFRTLKSTIFEVRRDHAAFIFEGRGFGHGVGLCQAGALARIRAGARAEAVLQRYYPGATLGRAD